MHSPGSLRFRPGQSYPYSTRDMRSEIGLSPVRQPSTPGTGPKALTRKPTLSSRPLPIPLYPAFAQRNRTKSKTTPVDSKYRPEGTHPEAYA